MVEPPAHLKGQYDIVHIRLLMSTVTGGDPKPLLKHCYELLSMLFSITHHAINGVVRTDEIPEPGGYLQWEEHDPLSYEIVRSRGSPAKNIEKFVADTREMVEKQNRPMK